MRNKPNISNAKKNDNKFRNKPKEVDGIKFASTKEANYYCELKVKQMAGIVKDFDLQVKFELIPKQKDERKVTYIADFVVEYADGHTEVVDVKGFRTREYILKRKLLKHNHPEWVKENTKFVEV